MYHTHKTTHLISEISIKRIRKNITNNTKHVAPQKKTILYQIVTCKKFYKVPYICVAEGKRANVLSFVQDINLILRTRSFEEQSFFYTYLYKVV